MDNIKSCSNNEDAMEVPLPDMEPHLLISTVRRYYLESIVKHLSENYVGWCGEGPPQAVRGAAKYFELAAAARAMLVPLYRRAVCSMLSAVKKCTARKDLYPKLQEYCAKSELSHKSTQTDLNNSINENIKNPICEASDNDIKHNGTKKSSTSQGNVQLVNIEGLLENKAISEEKKRQSSISSNDDEIMREMEEIFKDLPSSGKNDIYNNSTKDIHDSVNTSETVKTKDCPSSISNSHQSLDDRLNGLLGSGVPVTSQLVQKNYVYSRWPCELFYQKRRLRLKLDALCDKSYRKHSKVKQRFVEIFGPESEDEQGLQSPDTSPAFLRSCRQRAAPWLAHHLKRYFMRQLVAAHLFRPLARHLLYLLVQQNQYPDDYQVYMFLKMYFKCHPKIRSQADF